MTAEQHFPHRDPALWLSDQPVTITVTGLSMTPFLQEGDRVEAVRASSGDLKVGDLMVFLRGDEVVVHRFLTARGDLFLEKGDGQSRGNWAPWPAVLGRVTAHWRAEERVEFSQGPWPLRMTELGRANLRTHRVSTFAEKLPGTFLRRVFLRLFQRRR